MLQLDAEALYADLREGVRALDQSPGVVGYPYDAPDDASWVERAWFAQREPGRREVAGLSGGNSWSRRLRKSNALFSAWMPI
jgi:hypothetical protein